MLTLKNVLFTPIYAAHVMGKPWTSLLRELAPIVAITGLTIAAGRAMALAWPMRGWVELGAAAMIISVVYGLAVLQWALSAEERAMFRKILRRQPAQL